VEEFADYDKIPIKNNGVFRFAYDRICRVIRMNMKGLEKRTIKYRLHPFEGIQPVSLDDYFCEPVKDVKGHFETILFLANIGLSDYLVTQFSNSIPSIRARCLIFSDTNVNPNATAVEPMNKS